MARTFFFLAVSIRPVGVRIGLTGLEGIAEGKGSGRAGPASIFPFRLGGQAVAAALAHLLFARGQAAAKFLGVIPGYVFHRETPHVLPRQLGPAFALRTVFA